MKELKGKVTAISRYGGIKINDRWYNPSNDSEKERVIRDKNELLNKEVILVLDEKGKVIGYSFPKEPAKDMETVKSYQEQQKQKSDDITILALMKIGATLFQVLHEKKTYDELMKGVIAEYRRLQQDFRENGE
jgi:hypothetical protein